MPTFSAIALDRFLEPGASKSVDKSVPSSNPVPKPRPLARAHSLSNTNLERRNNASTTERKSNRPQISPALYATPESTPLPDSPSSSFPPSPYIVNHKGRGPRLLKSFSEQDVTSHQKSLNSVNDYGDSKNADAVGVDSSNGCSVTFAISDSAEECVNGVHVGGVIKEELVNGACSGDSVEEKNTVGFHNGQTRTSIEDVGSSNIKIGSAAEKDALKTIILKSEREGDSEDFFDPQESMSYTSSTDVEDNNLASSSMKLSATTPAGEYFDAWEELSSDSGVQPLHRDMEAELREMRLSLLMEIERRRQTEDAFNSMQIQWHRIREQLASVGLALPVCLGTVAEAEQQLDTNVAEELCRQVYLARFVSDSIGRGIARAEMEAEMEAQIEAKNFEIARLLDRLHYYEAVNREMSQRNQETIEMARRNRQERKRRQRWVWGSIAAAITLGTAALAWSYLPSAKGSSSTNDSLTVEHDDSTQ